MKIIVVIKGPLDKAVPIISIAQAFNSNKNNTQIICGSISIDLKKELENKGIKIYSHDQRAIKSSNRIIKNCEKIYDWATFRAKTKRLLDRLKFDLIYVATADTAISLYGIYKKYKYYLHLRELYDQFPFYMKMLKGPSENAIKVIVPEENRAYIYYSLLRLKDVPVVIPNKPYEHQRTLNLDISFLGAEIQDKLKHKKNIIYQGHLHKERDLSAFIKATLSLPQYNVVLMGKDFGMLDEYLKINPGIIHIPFIRPPLHLNITSWCHIGVITYDLDSLNTIYCAPNKVWEYAGFKMPILGNINPGLKTIVNQNRIGEIVEFKNETDIIRGIKMIEANYSNYQINSEIFFDSFNHDFAIKNLINL